MTESLANDYNLKRLMGGNPSDLFSHLLSHFILEILNSALHFMIILFLIKFAYFICLAGKKKNHL